MESSGTLGILVNPHSGRDARRLFARAGTSTIEDKRNQVTRIVVGAAAAGCARVLLARDAFRIASGAVDALALPIECELFDFETTGRGIDGQRAATVLRERGCGAVVALGGDGTSRAVTLAWPEVPLLPLSTGTNNVFPFEVEATVAGAAAGLLAAGRLDRDEACQRAKVVRIVCDDGRTSMALIDAALLVDDHPGSLLQVDPSRLAGVVLSRAEPASVGLSPVGGLLQPCDRQDDFGVEVRVRPGPDAPGRGKTLRAPLSPGLYGTVGIEAVRKLELGEETLYEGPGLLAFDGDREIVLEAGARARLWVERTGPFVIEPDRALRAAADRGLFLDLGAWHDHRDGAGGCC